MAIRIQRTPIIADPNPEATHGNGYSTTAHLDHGLQRYIDVAILDIMRSLLKHLKPTIRLLALSISISQYETETQEVAFTKSVDACKGPNGLYPQSCILPRMNFL